MNEIVKLHLDDLSLDTVVNIRDDLAKYAHLAAYRKVFETLALYISERKNEN